MPIYEFKCQQCGGAFEELFSSAHAAERIRCPQCASPDVERLVSAFGFASKGSGGEVVRSSAAGHSCGSCSSHACGHCH
ncbi:MAG TPA: zinc ribbon domain-containing protein [bacterium]|nr:zinc ribbon domain-containing protein [bacterium]HPR88587.1 zinc ribbon domain-containing protein [bacterium]